MYSNLQKAQLILSLLDDQAGSVLSYLSPSAASLLGASMGNMPERSDEGLKSVLVELHEKLREVQMEPPDMVDVDFSTPVSDSELDISTEVAEALGDQLPPEEIVFDSSAKADAYFEQPDRVVELLRDQKSQISAFIYNRLSLSQRQELENYLTDEEMDHYGQGVIEEIPLSDRIFDRMLASLKEESERATKLDDIMMLQTKPSDSEKEGSIVEVADDTLEDVELEGSFEESVDGLEAEALFNSVDLQDQETDKVNDEDGLDMLLDEEILEPDDTFAKAFSGYSEENSKDDVVSNDDKKDDFDSLDS